MHLEDPGTPLYELYQKKGKPVTFAEERDLARRKELVHAFCKKVASMEQRRRRRDQQYLERLWNEQELEYLRFNDWNEFVWREQEAYRLYLIEMERRRALGVETTPEFEKARNAFVQSVIDRLSVGKPPKDETEDMVVIYDANAPLDGSASASRERNRSSPS